MKTILTTPCVTLSIAAIAIALQAAEPPPIKMQPPAPIPISSTPPYAPDVPHGAKAYKSAKFTQSISILDDRDVIQPTPIALTDDDRWLQPGGMLGVEGYRAERFRFIPEGAEVKAWVGNVGVKNSFGNVQQNRGLRRLYPPGTRFDEVLYNAETGVVFEHRVRFKNEAGEWKSVIHHKDEEARPAGYTGLKVGCSSCHKECGTGKYAAGLVPGGDTVFSDPLPWHAWTRAKVESDK